MKLGMILKTMVAWMLLLNVATAADQKVIYGDDNRKDLHEVDDSLFLNLADSTAAMINASSLDITASGDTYNIKGSKLSERGYCKSERFSDQITSAMCSGFLVAPNLLVTAGHCIRSQSDCNRYRWVFGYGIRAKEAKFEVPSSEVYKCKKIVERRMTSSDQDDFALLELDREVEGHEPLKFRTEGKIEKGTELVVIGHPSGLPTKVADGAWVRGNNKKTYFSANLDTYGGNSGSAVFDAETGMVEGILVRGETDYVYDSSQGCRVSNVCSDEGCRGEDVVRITNIKALMNL